MKLHRYVDHQRLHIVTKDVISLSISVLLLFRHYISHKITFGAPSSGGVLRSACGAFISRLCMLFSTAPFSDRHPFPGLTTGRLCSVGVAIIIVEVVTPTSPPPPTPLTEYTGSEILNTL